MGAIFDPILRKLRSDEAASSALNPRGNWDADTNDPDITAEATIGDYWVVSVAGSTDLNGITTWAVGDKAIVGADGFMREAAINDRRADLEFVAADLIAGVLTVSGLDPIAAIVNASGESLGLVPITYGATNTTVDMSAFTLGGDTYKVRFSRGPQGEPGETLDMEALDEKTTLVDNDLFVVSDSEASGALKKVKRENVGGGGAALTTQQKIEMFAIYG